MALGTRWRGGAGAATGLVAAACAIMLGAAARGGLPANAVLEGVDVAALEAQAAVGLPRSSGARARTQALADVGAFGTGGVPSGGGRRVVFGNDGSGDEVELEPLRSSSARTQALYDTAGINAGAGGLVTPMQRATVCTAACCICPWMLWMLWCVGLQAAVLCESV